MTVLSPFTRKKISNTPFWSLNSDLESLWKVFDESPFKALENLRETSLAPKIDVIETDKSFEIRADMPGISQKDIEVSLDKNILTLRGQRKEEIEEKNDKKFHRIERHYGEYSRQLFLPENVDANNISADFSDGVLKVILPKLNAEVATRKTIEVKKS